jgi:hypothetical protein
VIENPAFEAGCRLALEVARDETRKGQFGEADAGISDSGGT